MRYFLLDSDWYSDCDDVMAVRLLANLHIQGKIRLLGINLDVSMKDSLRSLDGFLTYSGLPDLPISIDPDPETIDINRHLTYQFRLAKLPSRFQNNSEAETPVRFYRRLIVSAPEKVDLLSIGFLHDLGHLLNSPADDLSPLTGKELIREKVAHLWIMGGNFADFNSPEYNFSYFPPTRAATSDICANWPGKITFLGWEVGAPVISGAPLPEDDPLKQALNDHGSRNGRSSWDPLLAALAYAGSPEAAGYDKVNGYVSVDPETGKNSFRPDPDGPHCYVVKKHPDTWYADQVNSMIRLIPQKEIS